MKKLLLGLLFLTAFVPSSWAATYYVDTATGDNGNNGGPSDPVKEMIRAQEIGSNGDTVYVKSGTYIEPSVSGSGANGFTPTKAIDWIAVQGWDASGVPTLGGSVVLQCYSGTVNMYISGTTVKSFTGFTLNSEVAYGVLTSGEVGKTTFNNCIFTGTTNTGVYPFASSVADFEFNNCTFTTTAGIGLQIRGGNDVTLNNCTFTNSSTGYDIVFNASAGDLVINGGSASRTGASGYFFSGSTVAGSVTVNGTSFANYELGGSTALFYSAGLSAITIDGVTIANTVNNGYLVRTTVANTEPIIFKNSNVSVPSSNINTFLLNGQGPVTITNNTFTIGREGTYAAFAIQLATLASGGGATTITDNNITQTGYSTSGALIDIRNRYDAVTVARNTIISSNASNNSVLVYVLDANAPSITDNVINITAGALAQAAIWVNQADATVATSVATIARNKIHSTSEAGYYIALGTEATSTGDDNYDGSIIEHNEVYGVNYSGGTATSVHGLFVGFNIKCHVRHNYMNGAYYGIVVKSDSFDWEDTGGVYGNIFINNNVMGIYNKGSVNLNIFNNTVYANSTYHMETAGIYCAANVAANSSGTKIYNNIISNPKEDPLIRIDASNDTGVVISNNLYFNVDGSTADTNFYFPSSAYTTFATWASAASDTGSVYGNPYFADLNMRTPYDARIAWGSYANGIGKAITATGVTYTQDYFGGAIPSYINAGAHGKFIPYNFRRSTHERLRR